ncbi:MAG: hypothetical protein KGH69_02010 [Candidatus Micrarchaeota archaeon]|nr:hypothetical protein [Candidatus Micrarchaeota archaeon]
MHKGVLVYAAILIVLVIVVIFGLYGVGGLKKGGNSTITTTAAGQGNITTTLGPNQTSTTSTTTVPYTNYTSCLSSNSTESIANGDFSSGTYANWNASGPGFGSAPFNLTDANANGNYYNHTWENYDGTFFATSFQGGSSLQAGNLTSDSFIATEPYLNFRIISSQSALLYVEVLSEGNVVASAHYNTFNTSLSKYYLSTFQNASIPLVGVLCKPVQVRVVAGVTNAGAGSSTYQYIAIGDFKMSKSPAQARGIVVNQTIK